MDCRNSDSIIGIPILEKMDWDNPLRSIAATVDADVLKALADTHEEVTGNHLARLAERSYAQVYAVVRRMTAEGLVHSSRHGRTNTYRLNRDHILAAAVSRILASPARVESEIRLSVGGWDPPPETIALVGPAAWRNVDRDGEIHMLIVRPDSARGNDLERHSQSDALARRIEKICGNHVRILDFNRMELTEAARDNRTLSELLGGGVRIVSGRRLSIGAHRATPDAPVTVDRG